MKTLALSLCRAAALSVLLGTAWTASADLVNRYSFNGNANDSVGGKNGTLAQLRDAGGPVGSPVTFVGGQAVLDGSGGYIDLPNGLVSTLTNITVETWITWGGSGTWSRIFEFGNSNLGEDTDGSLRPGNGVGHFFLTVLSPTLPRLDVTAPSVTSTTPLPANEQVHIAITYGPSGSRLFINGAQTGSGNFVVPLSSVQDVNVWIGRSDWTADPLFNGSYNEFRIHNNLLGAPEMKASVMSGPDTLNYDPGAVSALTISVTNAMLIGQVATPQLSATFARVGATELGTADVTLTSSAPGIVRVNANGSLQALAVGTATITAARGGQSAVQNVSVASGAPAVLKHRYSFDGSSTSKVVTDSVGAQNGEIKPPFATTGVPNPGAVIQTNGQAFFPSGTAWDSAGYIDLPNGLISSKTNITIETWVTWNGPNSNAGQTWARIFDFGDSTKGEDAQFAGNGTQRSYLFLTPRANANTMRFAAQPTGGSDATNQINLSPTIAIGTETHLVVVYAPSLSSSRLYVNGALVGTTGTPFALRDLVDINNWLGASQWQDTPYYGFINEFRIYEGALSDVEVALDRSAGPNTISPAPGPLQSISVTASALYTNNPTAVNLVLAANFQNVTNVDVRAVAGATFTSSNTNIFTVSATGGLLPRNVGTASLLASFQGLSATTAVSVLAPTALRQDLASSLPAGGAPVVATLRADFPGAANANINVTGFTGVTRSSSDTNIATIAANGTVLARNPGTVTLTATYAGLTSQHQLTVALPAGLVRGQLVHRYSFSGAKGTTVVTDSVGTSHGEFVGIDGVTNDFTGTGQLSMGGSAWNANPLGGYVNLPNRLVSTLSNVTLEGWALYRGGAVNQRLFDFGMSSGAPDAGGPGIFGEDAVANPGRSYFFLTPAAGPRFAINQGTAGENPSITSSVALTLNTNQHFAVVYDPVNGVARLYINGVRTGTAAAAQPLSTVDDRNVWLGRSVWQDPLFNGVYDEFRIWNGPLLDSDIAASFAGGPNSVIVPGANDPVAAPKFSSASVTAGSLRVEWTGGGTLESATSISGPWATVAGATSPYTTSANDAARFYRVRGQ